MEGRPLAKCVCPFSDRGRNAKGILEKMIEGLFGDYYSDAPNTIFTAYNLSPRSCLMLKTANMKSQPAYKTKKMSRVTTVNENPFRKKGDDNSHGTAALGRQFVRKDHEAPPLLQKSPENFRNLILETTRTQRKAPKHLPVQRPDPLLSFRHRLRAAMTHRRLSTSTDGKIATNFTPLDNISTR